MSNIRRPQVGEYSPYFQGYIDLVPEGDFMEMMRQNTAGVLGFLEQVPEDKQDYRYAEGKWTIKQVLMHMADVERVMCYRALVTARGDSSTVLYSMDDQLYVQNGNAERPFADMIAEFMAVRGASEQLFGSMTSEQAKVVANAAGHIITARALGYIVVGHVLHHMKVTRERYL